MPLLPTGVHNVAEEAGQWKVLTPDTPGLDFEQTAGVKPKRSVVVPQVHGVSSEPWWGSGHASWPYPEGATHAPTIALSSSASSSPPPVNMTMLIDQHLRTFGLFLNDILTKFIVGRDGLTGWERLKGRKYSGLLFQFGTKRSARRQPILIISNKVYSNIVYFMR